MSVHLKLPTSLNSGIEGLITGTGIMFKSSRLIAVFRRNTACAQDERGKNACSNV